MTETGKQPTTLAPGSRLRCPSCGSEAIVMQAGAVELTCCDVPLVVIFDGSRQERG